MEKYISLKQIGEVQGGKKKRTAFLSKENRVNSQLLGYFEMMIGTVVAVFLAVAIIYFLRMNKCYRRFYGTCAYNGQEI